jgi:hypothetical protein
MKLPWWLNPWRTVRRLQHDNEALKAALSELVYKDSDGKWKVGIRGDEDVTDIIGDVLR